MRETPLIERIEGWLASLPARPQYIPVHPQDMEKAKKWKPNGAVFEGIELVPLGGVHVYRLQKGLNA